MDMRPCNHGRSPRRKRVSAARARVRGPTDPARDRMLSRKDARHAPER